MANTTAESESNETQEFFCDARLGHVRHLPTYLPADLPGLGARLLAKRRVLLAHFSIKGGKSC